MREKERERERERERKREKEERERERGREGEREGGGRLHHSLPISTEMKKRCMGTPRRGEERLSSQLGDIGNRRREIRRKRRLPWSSDSCGGKDREEKKERKRERGERERERERERRKERER